VLAQGAMIWRHMDRVLHVPGKYGPIPK
jgi:hypothetical protein